MSLKIASVLILIFYSGLLQGQVISDDVPEILELQPQLVVPDSDMIQKYCDSISRISDKNFVCGYISTIYHEPAVNIPLEGYIKNDSSIRSLTNNYGLFTISLPVIVSGGLTIKINASDYYAFDTLIKDPEAFNRPIKLELKPRYKLLIRGRAISGTLPLDNVSVEIVHLHDTFKTATLGCYTDSENYWNCLYLGIFKQSVIFENPSDSITIRLTKEGYYEKKISLQCNEYDGSIIPVHLKYTNLLPNLLQSSISLKLAMPFFDNWNAGLNYSYILKIGKFDRIGIGLEALMHISEHSMKHPVFRDPSSPSDTLYQMASFDTSYTSLFIGPQFVIWLSNPMKRQCAFYAGMNIPFSFPQKEIYLHPFAGCRFFLDSNKALFIELSYLRYHIDVVQYEFNPFGISSSYTINESFEKLLLNVGLQMCF